MINILNEEKINLNNLTCHTGGAEGSDSMWEKEGMEYGVRIKAYSYKTPKHQSKNKVEISDEDYNDGIIEIHKANKWLKRRNLSRYMNLLARNWSQVKYSDQIFAIGYIINPDEKTIKGYYNKCKYQVLDGGTSWAVIMGILNFKDIFVFDQNVNNWFKWSYNSMKFIKLDYTPKIKFENFAGIGTRNITEDGVKAIKNVYESTFN